MGTRRINTRVLVESVECRERTTCRHIFESLIFDLCTFKVKGM